MKKVLFMGFAAAAILTGCNNDEIVNVAQKKAIGFESFVDKSTRATIEDDVTLANLSSIEVYGWRNDEQIFNAQEVAVSTSGEGSYNPLQYWEAGYTYAFEAIAPKSGDKGVTFAAAKTGGEITFVNDAETDLLYAKVADVTMGESISEKPAAVSFVFKHLLSRVMFTFVNGFPENAVAKISVTDVTITNAYKNGVIIPATGDVWNATDNTLVVPFANVNATNIAAGNAAGETEHMYLIPVAEPEYTITFTVILDQNGATTDYRHTTTINTGMAQGLSYNFVAMLTPENIDPVTTMYPIEFKAEVDSWVDFQNSDVTLE